MGRNDTPLTDEQRKLIEDNEALLHYFFHRYRRKFPGEDDADLLEIIFLAAVKAAKKYTSERGNWSTLLGYAVEMELRKFYRQKSAAMRSGYETVHWKDDSDLEYMLGETAALPDMHRLVRNWAYHTKPCIIWLTSLLNESAKLSHRTNCIVNMHQKSSKRGKL